MGRITLYEKDLDGARIKIDADATFSHDAKKAHVVITYKSDTYPLRGHLYLEDIDRFSVNHDWPDPVQKAFREVKRMKNDIIRKYDETNKRR